MGCVDLYGQRLTGGADAVAAYNRGVGSLLRLEEGSLHAVAASLDARPHLRPRPRGAGAARPRVLCAGRHRGPAARRGAARAPQHRAGAQPRRRGHRPRRRRLRPAGRPPRPAPHRRAAAQRRGADHRVRRRHDRAAGRLADRGGLRAGVRRRLVVHRAARVHAPGAGPLRRGDGAVLPLARRRAGSRPLGPRPRPRPLRDRRPRRGARLDGRLDHRRRLAGRQPEPLLVARRDARAVDRRPRRGASPLRVPAAPPRRDGLPQPGGLGLAAVALGADPRQPLGARHGRRARGRRRHPALGPADPVHGDARRGGAAARPTTPTACHAGALVRGPRRHHPRRGGRAAGVGAAAAGPRRRVAAAPTRSPSCSPGCGGSAAATRSARSSRRPGSARCCVPAAARRRWRSSTSGSTADAAAATSGSRPRLS